MPKAPAAEACEAVSETPEGFHALTITKRGDGKVHTGVGVGETFRRGDAFHAPLDTAHALEALGYAEADGELPPLPADGE